MAIELGPAQAILYGTTPPQNTKVLWGETDNNDPNTQVVIKIWRFDNLTNQWVGAFDNAEIEWSSTNW